MHADRTYQQRIKNEDRRIPDVAVVKPATLSSARLRAFYMETETVVL